MKAWVTRPAAEAQAWVEGLRRLGHDAVSLPLIAIAPAPDGTAILRAWEALPAAHAAMFVSANAVRGFQAANPGAPWPAQPRAWATGEGTRAALVAAGVPGEAIDTPAADSPQFDSEALWARVGAGVPPGARVLVVRGAEAGAPGGSGRDWLADRLREAGATVDTVVAYVRSRPGWDDATRARALREFAERVWLFSSSQAIAHLRELLPEAPCSSAACVATHPRIAQAARDAGFGVVRESRPGLADVAATLESIG